MERSLLAREKANGMYGVTSYFFGKFISNLPFAILFPLISSVITFFMLNLNNQDPSRFWIFFLSLTLASFSSSSMGLWLGCMFPNAQVAVTLGPMVTVPSTLFAGYYVSINSIPVWLRWIQYLSLFKWSFQAVAVNEFHDATFTCSPGEICSITSGNQVLQELNMTYPSDLWVAIGVLAGLTVLFRLLAFVFLIFQTKRDAKKDQ